MSSDTQFTARANANRTSVPPCEHPRRRTPGGKQIGRMRAIRAASEPHAGLVAALGRLFQGVGHQRCWVHFVPEKPWDAGYVLHHEATFDDFEDDGSSGDAGQGATDKTPGSSGRHIG